MTDDPYKTDLSSLRIFRAVYDQRSFSKAADVMGVNQSVVSYAIDKLRQAFNDQLFLRQGGGIVPTDRCVTIAASSSIVLDEFEMLIAPQHVDPATLDRTFRISCNFIERALIVPLITKALRKAAPEARLSVIQARTDGVRQLSQGLADLLIGPIRPDSDRFFCRSLVKDTYACVMDPANPLASDRLSLEQYLTAKRVEVSYGDDWTSDYRARLGTSVSRELLEARVTVPSPAEIGRIIEGTDLIATIPSLYAETLKPGLHVVRFPLPSTLDIDLVWSQRTQGSSTQKWFRDLVVEAAKPLGRNTGAQQIQ